MDFQLRPGRNILSKVAYPFTEGEVGIAVHTDIYVYGNPNWKDQLTAYNGVLITYDAIGNPLSDGTWTNTWQHGRQLANMAKPGETVSFVYNEDGLRVQKTTTSTGVTKYVLHGKNIVHLINGQDELHFFYDAQGKVAVVEYNGVCYRYLHNLQGDVIALVDRNGEKVVEYWYDAWGKPLSKTGSMAETLGTVQPFRYRGYVWDEETGLYYLRSRYYRPEWGRFLTIDSLVKGNVYQYGNCQPICMMDANGLDSIWITDNNSLSHVSLFIQTAEGSWYYFYWGASKNGSSSSGSANMSSNTSSSSSSSIGEQGNGIIIYKKVIDFRESDANFSGLSEKEMCERINKRLVGIYGGDYDACIYIPGDFSRSHERANEMNKHQSNMVYKLLAYNCADVVCDVLMSSFPTDSDIYKGLERIRDNYIIPKHMHREVERLVHEYITDLPF